MARRYRHNPDVLGYDLFDVLEEGAGAALATVGNDKLASPIVRGMLPGLYANEMFAKAIDAGTTILTGWVLGKGIGMWNKGIARRIERGAALIATVKAASIVVPGWTLNATLPTSFANPLQLLGGGAAPKPAPDKTALIPAQGVSMPTGPTGL